jgi:hypothetical protein
MIRDVHPGSRFRILIFHPSRIPDPEVKQALDPGSSTLRADITLFHFWYADSGNIKPLPVLPVNLDSGSAYEERPIHNLTIFIITTILTILTTWFSQAVDSCKI